MHDRENIQRYETADRTSTTPAGMTPVKHPGKSPSAVLAVVFSLLLFTGCGNPAANDPPKAGDNPPAGNPPAENPPAENPPAEDTVAVLQWLPNPNVFSIIPCDTKIRATFDGGIDFSSVNTSTFAVKDAEGNTISGTFTYADPVLTFTPQALLTLDKEYRITVSGILDGDGDQVEASFHHFTTAKRVLRVFTRGLGGYYHCPVAERNGFIYVGTSRMEAWDPAPDNGIFKLDENLALVWEYPLGYSEAAGGATIDSSGNVYIVVRENSSGATKASRGGNVYLYKLNSSGVRRWQALVYDGGIGSHDMINPALSADENTIYVPGGKLYAVNTADGSVIWSHPEGSLMTSPRHSVVIRGQYLYYGNEKLNITLTPGDPGFVVWNGSCFINAPALSFDGSTLYGSEAGTTTPVMYIIDAANGSAKETFDVPLIEGDQVYVWDSPAVDANGNIYFGSKTYSNVKAVFYALDKNGTKLWQCGTAEGGTGSDMYSSPVLGDDGVVYCGSEGSKVNAYRKSDGAYLWAEPIGPGDTIYGSPIIRDGYLYVASIGDSEHQRGGAVLKIDIDATGYEANAGSPCFQGGNAKTGRLLDQ